MSNTRNATEKRNPFRFKREWRNIPRTRRVSRVAWSGDAASASQETGHVAVPRAMCNSPFIIPYFSFFISYPFAVPRATTGYPPNEVSRVAVARGVRRRHIGSAHNRKSQIVNRSIVNPLPTTYYQLSTTIYSIVNSTHYHLPTQCTACRKNARIDHIYGL